MSEISSVPEERARRINQAVDWFVRVSADDASETELSEWLSWSADARNAAEFSRIRGVWAGVDQLIPQATELLNALEKQAASSNDALPGKRAPRFQFAKAVIMVAAAALGCVAVTPFWSGHEAEISEHAPNTPAALNTSTELPDGSVLTLAPRTDIAIDFSGSARRLTLSQGEAYFKVHPDKSKPFIVRTGELTVTAVGTAFDVRSESGRTIVTVQEGTVDIAAIRREKSLKGGWRVSAGYQVSYDAARSDARLSSVDAVHALSWREGRLQYFNAPLEDVVKDVSRYSAQPIVVEDPRVGKLSFTGTVFVNSIGDWLGAIQSTFPVRAVVTKGNSVLLVRADGEGAADASP
jgi:transmembrane sensor